MIKYFYSLLRITMEVQMTDIECFIETIKEYMKKGEINKKELAKRAELSYKSVCDILNHKRTTVFLKTIIKLSIGLGLKAAELLDETYKKIRE